MPTADQLPDDLKDLAYRNALTLNNLDWDSNVAKLTNTHPSSRRRAKVCHNRPGARICFGAVAAILLFGPK